MLSNSPSPTTARRILHVVTWLNRGGIETWLIRFIRKAHERGDFHVDVLCRGLNEGVLANQARDLGADVISLPMARASRANARHLADVLLERRYELVHSHVNAHNALAVKAAKLAGIPSVVMYHNENLFAQHDQVAGVLKRLAAKVYVNQALRYGVSNADCVTAVSSAVREVICKSVPGDAEKVRVVYLGTDWAEDLSQYQRSEIRARVFGVDQATPVIIHVGSFTRQKNHEGVLAAFAALRRLGRLAHLVLVGDGPRWNEVQALVMSHGFSSDISLLGSRDDVGELMQAADLFFLPSFHEGLPITMMEAFAADLPVVASDIPSIREALGPDYPHLLSAPDREQELARSLAAVLDNPALANSMAEIGQERFKQLFSIDASYQRLASIYGDLLSAEQRISEYADFPTKLAAVGTDRSATDYLQGS